MRRSSQLAPPKSFERNLYEILRGLQKSSVETQFSIAALGRGEAPDGSGLPVIDTSLFVLLNGRPFGQVIHGDTQSGGKMTLVSTLHGTKGKIYFGKDETAGAFDEATSRFGFGTVSPAVLAHFSLSSTGLSALGSMGTTLARFSAGGTDILDFKSYLFDTGVIEIALTDSTGTGIPVNFPSDDGTSGLRFASTTNRAFIQCGIRESGGQIGSASLTVGGLGARIGTSLAFEFKRVKFTNSAAADEDGVAVSARTTRVGINVDPDEYANSSTNNKGQTLHIATIAGMDTTAPVDPAPLVIENAAGTSVPMLEIRNVSSGSSPTKVLGVVAFDIHSGGSSDTRLRFYNSGTMRLQIRTDNPGELVAEDGSGNNVLSVIPLTRWADSVASTTMRVGVTTANVIISGGGFNTLARFGVSATSTVIGPASTATLPAPLSSRILTLVNASATPVVHVGSTGAFTINPSTDVICLKIKQGAGGSADLLNIETVGGTTCFVVSSVGQIAFAGTFTVYDTDIVGGAPTIFDASSAAGGGTITIPDLSGGSGSLVLTSLTQTITGTKTFSGSTVLSGLGTRAITSTSSSGFSFYDTANSTKRLRIVLTNASAHNHAFSITATAARTYTFPDLTGNMVMDNGTLLTSGRVPFATTGGALNDSSLFLFDTTNGLTISALNLITDTTTGMKIGTATTQKLGFWNATPIVQPTTAIAAATFVANTSGVVDDSATFDGYTLGQVVKALRNAGLLA